MIKALLRNNVVNELALALPMDPTAGGAPSSAQISAPSGAPSGAEGALHAAAVALSLHDFEPIGVLGFGSSAQVRLMRNSARAGELHAVKSIFKRRGGKDLSGAAVARVVAEREILRAAHEHPFVVTLIDAFEDTSCYHLVLEYASNGSLSQWLVREPLPEPTARLVSAEVISALAHLHGLQIIYRDLKPENVLVLASGHVVLADFGVSKRTGAEAYYEANSLVGTPGFIAPEILARSSHGCAADWWALGAMLHSMLTCEEPMHVQTVLALLQEPPPRAAVLAAEHISHDLSPAASSLISSLLALQPKNLR